MNGTEIKGQIEKNNLIIENYAATGMFVLTPEVKEALAENKRLRKICKHVFNEAGFCIYCNSEDLK